MEAARQAGGEEPPPRCCLRDPAAPSWSLTFVRDATGEVGGSPAVEAGLLLLRPARSMNYQLRVVALLLVAAIVLGFIAGLLLGYALERL
jgi:hypothetical protein